MSEGVFDELYDIAFVPGNDDALWFYLVDRRAEGIDMAGHIIKEHVAFDDLF